MGFWNAFIARCAVPTPIPSVVAISLMDVPASCISMAPIAGGLRVDINAGSWNDLGAISFQDIGAKYQAAGLLHELGHIYGYLSGIGSGGTDIKYDGLPWQGSVSEANMALILKDCFGITN